MGISRGAINLLGQEVARRPFSGKLLTFGRMKVVASPGNIEALGLPPSSQLDDTTLFSRLGFDQVDSLDVSDYERASIIHDLNQPLPEHLHGKYDVVLDSGTIEHVFDVRQSLRNAVDATKTGGRIILLSPSSNHMDHGFYMFSPTLFVEYFRANNIDVVTARIARYDPIRPHRLWDVYDYTGEQVFSIGCLDGSPYVIFIVATKTERSTSNRIPQQGAYHEAWGKASANASGPSRLYQTAERFLSRIPGAMKLAVNVRTRMKARGVKALPLVGRL